MWSSRTREGKRRRRRRRRRRKRKWRRRRSTNPVVLFIASVQHRGLMNEGLWAIQFQVCCLVNYIPIAAPVAKQYMQVLYSWQCPKQCTSDFLFLYLQTSIYLRIYLIIQIHSHRWNRFPPNTMRSSNLFHCLKCRSQHWLHGTSMEFFIDSVAFGKLLNLGQPPGIPQNVVRIVREIRYMKNLTQNLSHTNQGWTLS